jgi:hypothetical protein
LLFEKQSVPKKVFEVVILFWGTSVELKKLEKKLEILLRLVQYQMQKLDKKSIRSVKKTNKLL